MNTVTCHICGKQDKPHFSATTNHRMVNESVCFNCLFWLEKVDLKDDPRSIRIKGVHYFGEDGISSVYKPALGHGGQEFKVRFHDGRTITTNNLWRQGAIPEHFKSQLPDNAEFVT